MNEQTRVAEREPQSAQTADRPVALFQSDEGNGFRTRWDAIQTGFVDEPRAAVEQANALVGEMM